MPEIIQNWLGTKLGILIDMSPKKFGRNTKDGTLLAKLLYNYGVIPAHVLENVKESKNYYECYNNLVLLKPWLKYIGVVQEDSTLQKMAGGEGSAAISVFYSVYLNLERKDRLHYMSAQKERRISQDSCDKFKVSLLPEQVLCHETGDVTMAEAAPIYESADMIEWHKAKCKKVIEQIKKTKARIQKATKKKMELGPLVSKHSTSQPLDKRQMEAELTREEITEFEKKHVQESPDLNFSQLTELQNMSEMQPCFVPSMSEALNIMNSIKKRKKGDIYARDFQQKMQNILLDEQWKEIIEQQEKNFESQVCANLLKQSQYEKQMAKKLALIRNQKRVLAENRQKVENLKIDLCQRDYEGSVFREMEMWGEYQEDEDFETERIEELHRRFYDEKVRRRREMIRIESRRICEALVGIAIRISEFREKLGCEIPKTNMKELKHLFFKDLPIFDILDHPEDLCVQESVSDSREEEGAGETDDYREREFERLKSEEMSRMSILDESDFNDYLHLMGPWMVELLFPNGSDTEINQFVLGYIVHRILAVKYPPPKLPVPADIKPMKTAAVVHGLTDEAATNMLKDLMEACGILLVRVDDAINFVLAAYKEEMSVVRDVDLSFQKSTEDALQHVDSNPKEKEYSRKLLLLKVPLPEVIELEGESMMIDKETQTPRMIPEDDPLLSPNAEIGKQAFESLGVGDPVPDFVIASAVVAYVSSKQEEYNGWVLLNYPLLYSQASDLEYCLTGWRTLPILEDMVTVEETEGFSYRGPWGNSFGRDPFGGYRISKLVPRPDVLVLPAAEIPKTYFDSLIKLKKIPGTPRRRSQDSEEFGPMEKFYLDLGVLSNFEYQNLNFQTVKNLGKEILKTADVSESELVQKNSVEIFGSVILELNEKWEPKRKNPKESVKKQPTEPKNGAKLEEEIVMEPEESYEEVIIEDRGAEGEPGPPKPGDPHWQWATGTPPEDYLVALASLWENMEAIYIEDFKNVFFSLRVHRFNVVNYCGFVRKSLRILMRRPDEKQKVLSKFQKMFNEIDEDLRPDVDIKCELHVRVSELEQALMDLADNRKKNSLADTLKTSQDGWVADEIVTLLNAFLTALQLEVDRSIDSCQVITDYYMALQQKDPDLKPLVRIQVPKVVSQAHKYSVTSSASFKTSGSPRNSDPRRSLKSMSEHSKDKISKTRSLGDKRKRSSDTSGLVGASEFIMDILVNLSLPEDGLTPFHIFFMDTIQSVTDEVRNVIETCMAEAKKWDKTGVPATRQTKQSKKPSVSEPNVANATNENLFAEWMAALESELNRFTFRSQLLLARGIFDMNEFLTMILNILSSITEEITEMYLKEIHSITECCKVFRCGIEQEVQILPELELMEDEFIVHLDGTEQDGEEFVNMNVRDLPDRFAFTIDQLNLLHYKLQKVAPDGEIIKKSLVYIFQDLRMLNPEVENCRCFPEIWNDIEPDDVTTILNEVYQDLEIVHWKDFIIYALELPSPTEHEILSMRQLFRKFDPLVTELIPREKYDTVPFWFENDAEDDDLTRYQDVKDLLYRMYQVNELQTNYSALLLAFCKDENPVWGFEKALTLAMGKTIKRYEESAVSWGGEYSYGSGLFDDYHRDSFPPKQPPCCPTPSMAVAMQCIPREKIVRCECKDEVESSAGKSTELQYNYAEDAGEYVAFPDSKSFDQYAAASLIPFSILLSLLKASFPSLPQLSILLDCQQTFQETLSAIYDSLDSNDNTVELHKLLNHKFIHRLLHSTNKFKVVKLKPILLSLAKTPMGVTCMPDKPIVNNCLRN